ncbi:MAG: polysaccharide deacetylase family protein [Actinomycetota bacterium]
MDRPDLEERRAEQRARRRRRRTGALAAVAVVAVAGVAAAGVVMSGGGSGGDDPPAASTATSTTPAYRQPTTASPAPEPPPADTTAEARAESPQRIRPPAPGPATVITEGPASAGRKVALTIDDGTCPSCVDRILDVVEKTGGKVTLFPNGVYGRSWEPQAQRIRKLVDAGQVTLGNHTYSHGVSTQIGATAFAADLQRNEDWIQKTFKVTGRPWFRPPYGDHNASIDAAAGQRGYRKVIMWSGTVADSQPRSEGYILDAIDYWARPGSIILMHANYPATAKALPKIFRALEKKRLQPVTLAELLGGSAQAPQS